MAKHKHPYLKEPGFPSYLFNRYKSCHGNCLDVLIFIIGEIWLTLMNIPVIILDIIYAILYRILELCRWGSLFKQLTPKLAIHSRKYRQIGFYCFLEDLQSEYQDKDEDIGEETDQTYKDFVNKMLVKASDGDELDVQQEDGVENTSKSKNSLRKKRNPNDEISLGIELFYICKTNQINKLRYIMSQIPSDVDICSYQCELQPDCGWEINHKIGKNDFIKMSLLHVALLRGSFDVALELIQPKPNYKCMLFQEGLHHVTCLHLALLQHNPEVVKKIFESLGKDELEEILYLPSTTRSLRSSDKGAQLPLSLAVLSGNTEIVDSLIEANVDLNKQDNYGYNIFHSLVLQSLEDEETALIMFDKIIKYVPIWWKVTVMDAPKASSASARLEALSSLFKQKTYTENLTPLGLAAYLGASVMMERILNTEDAYRFKIMEFGKQDLVCYDMTEIDTTIDPDYTAPSILEILVGAKTDNALKSMNIPVIDKLITEKWNNYFMYYFLVSLLYVAFLIVYTVNLTNHMDLAKMGLNTTYTSDSTTLGWVNNESTALFLSGIFIIGCLFYFLCLGLAILIGVIVELARRRFRSIAFVLAWRRLLLSSVVVFVSLAAHLGFVFRVGDDLFQKVCVIITLVCGWALLIFFMQGFKPTAIFSIMFERILFRDVLLFALGYICIAIGFASAFWLNMSVYVSGTRLETFRDPGYSLFTLFRLMLGLIDTDELFDTKFPLSTYAINVVLFIAYIAVTTILLLNMLIASMTYTYDRIKAVGLIWKKLRTNNMQMIEHVLPSFILLYCSNYPTKTCKLREKINGKWRTYERVIHFYKL